MALARLRALAPALVIATVAVAIAYGFVQTVLHYTRPFAFPLDDSYIYLTYAKQFGRGEPFSYYSGGGYSAGSTSALWPMVLAPFWALGARGQALVWVSYGVCTALYALTAAGVWRVIKKLGGDDTAGICAALLLLGIAPFAWTALSGMEVAFASALLVALILLLIEQAPTGPPTKRLGVVMAAASLSRPEAMLLVLAIAGIAVLARLRLRQWRAAAWWLAPLVAPIAWLVANRTIAGNFFPNTGIAKSYFYLPGFDWTYWLATVKTTTWQLVKGLFWDDASPLVWPRLVAVGWFVGAVRVLRWAHRAHRWLAGMVIVVAPLVLLFAVVASSGLWNFQNYRYIGPVFPLLVIPVGLAVAPLAVERRGAWPLTIAAIAGVSVAVQLAPVIVTNVILWLLAAAPVVLLLPARWGRAGFTAIAFGLFTAAAVPKLDADAKLFAQGSLDVNTQVVTIGHFVHANLPDASVMFHDAGAIAYFGDGRVFDMLGLVTNHQAGIANHGAGARFEFLENLTPDRRPTHFAYYPGWLGTGEFFGEVLLDTPRKPGIRGLEKSPLVGDSNMQVIVADFDHVHSGEQPLAPVAGWRMVDRIDIADLASEQAHDWRGGLGRRNTGDPTARWSFVGREVGEHGLVLDGGRTIREGGEQFTIEVDASQPVRLLLRTGGAPAYSYHETIGRPVELRVLTGDRELARAQLPVPDGRFAEIAFQLPAGVSEIRTVTPLPYRAFHWFVLQPTP
ncbi:MAG: hypothetical protein ABI867_42045 [Kofleriaceae bacterium]